MPKAPPDLIRLSREKPLTSEGGKVLLIGATGQIGEHIKPLLDELYPGKVIGISSSGDPDKNIQKLSLSDTDGLKALIKKENVETVINLAAFLSSRSQGDPKGAREVNFLAVKRLIEGCKDLGVTQVFTPSTIAVYGPDDDRCPNSQSATHPTGAYGESKVEMEHFMRKHNKHNKENTDGKGPLATSLRLGGILTCKIPPCAGGTAMEFDKIIIAAAHEKKHGKGAICTGLEEYYEKGTYHPNIPADAKMPFIHVDDAAREILRFVHNAPDLDKKHAVGHHLAAFTLKMQDLCGQLSQKTNNQFSCTFDERSKTGAKADFTRQWPPEVDTSECAEWGFNPDHCKKAHKAIFECFDRVQEAYKPAARRIS